MNILSYNKIDDKIFIAINDIKFTPYNDNRQVFFSMNVCNIYLELHIKII